jgi:hypothetical protein
MLATLHQRAQDGVPLRRQPMPALTQSGDDLLHSAGCCPSL